MSVVSPNLEENDDVNLRGSPKHYLNFNKMLCIGREICFLMLIVFTAYASMNSTTHSASGPPPAPMFPRGSPVADFYRGQLSEALLRASEADVSFVMYYAPWDAESREMQRHFETVALQHYKQVYFAAINCWQPKGECRRTLSKIQQFPKLVAYVTHETGVEYRGPRDVRYMSLFLENIIRPLHRVSKPEDLTRLRSTYNAVVVAFLNFHGPRGGPPYRALYETAFKFLEKDVKQEIAFAVVTSFKTTRELGGNRTPHIKLYLWNETLDFPGHFSSDVLFEWIQSRLHQVTLWISPPGVKSLTLAPYVVNSPALVMFTPADNFVMYDLLREVGLEYYNCNNSSDVSQLAQNISACVSERVGRMRRAAMSCHSRPVDLATTVQIAPSVWTNSSCDRRKRQCLVATTERATLCQSPSPDVDQLSAPALMDWYRREACRRLSPPPPRPPPTLLAPKLRGLACRHNMSVSLLAMDSISFPQFAKGLGLDIGQMKGQTAVVLMNPEAETTYLLSEAISRASLSQFLVNFTEGTLERFQRTSLPPPPPVATSLPTVRVAELTTATFMDTVFNDSLHVVILYYSPYCGYCQSASLVYLTVARRLRSVPALLFTRIDGEKNDLPWHLTAPRYPTILIFPAGRKAESRVFTGRVGFTADSLTQFVLANLPLETRLFAMVQLCYQTQTQASRRGCMVQVRRELVEAISAHLLRYRALSVTEPTDAKRSALRRVVGKLQRLKQLQLSLSVDTSRLPHLLNPTATDNSARLTRPKDEL